ncbi:ORF51A [Ictalurid herpesvirus 1]|nr:ORF51A [Ictalurid herpesvirus 1]
MINMTPFEVKLRNRVQAIRKRKTGVTGAIIITLSVTFLVLIAAALVTENRVAAGEFGTMLLLGLFFALNRGVTFARAMAGCLSMYLLMRVFWHRCVQWGTATDDIFVTVIEVIIGIGFCCSIYNVVFHRYLLHYRDRLRTWREWPSI